MDASQRPRFVDRAWRPALVALIVVSVGGAFVYREFLAEPGGGARTGAGVDARSPGVIDQQIEPAVGEPAPDFVLQRAGEGDLVALSDYRGRTVVLNFWATWCPPCRAEMPEFQELYEERLDDEDFVVLAVDVRESEDPVLGFADELGLTFPLVIDHTGDVAQHYGVRGLPASFFIDADGVIRERVMGPVFGSILHDSVALADAGGEG